MNFVIAERAWGTFAGKMIVSPSFIWYVLPATQTSHSPSRIVTTASKGAVCSESPSFSSNEKIVMLPLFRLMSIRLATVPSE